MKTAAAITEEFTRYAYSVSHDLSAPVRAMVEFSKILASSDARHLDAEGKECLYLIIENGKKLQQMIDALLQYSRIHTETRPLTTVKMEDVIARAQARLQRQIDASHAVISCGPMPTVAGDPEQLLLLMAALIENGLLYQPKGQSPRIRIAAQHKDNRWHFSVTDNGIGIPLPFQTKVFHPFQRLHSEEECPGIGMGLTLAQKIAERHGGSMAIDPSVQEGTSIHFSLPTTDSSERTV